MAASTSSDNASTTTTNMTAPELATSGLVRFLNHMSGNDRVKTASVELVCGSRRINFRPTYQQHVDVVRRLVCEKLDDDWVIDDDVPIFPVRPALGAVNEARVAVRRRDGIDVMREALDEAGS